MPALDEKKTVRRNDHQSTETTRPLTISETKPYPDSHDRERIFMYEVNAPRSQRFSFQRSSFWRAGAAGAAKRKNREARALARLRVTIVQHATANRSGRRCETTIDGSAGSESIR